MIGYSFRQESPLSISANIMLPLLRFCSSASFLRTSSNALERSVNSWTVSAAKPNLDRNDILKKDAYFEQTVMSQVKQGMDNTFIEFFNLISELIIQILIQKHLSDNLILISQQAKGDFDLIFDQTMIDIADKNIDIFSTQTTQNTNANQHRRRPRALP